LLGHSHSLQRDCSNRHDTHRGVEFLKQFLTWCISISVIMAMFVYFLFKRNVDACFLWLLSDVICIPCVAYKTLTSLQQQARCAQVRLCCDFQIQFECFSSSLEDSFIRMLKTLDMEKQNERENKLGSSLHCMYSHFLGCSHSFTCFLVQCLTRLMQLVSLPAFSCIALLKMQL